MSYYVDGSTITLTRGDTLKLKVSITRPGGGEYVPQPGDVVRFAMKRTVHDAVPALVKEIPVDTMMLVIGAEDTKNLRFGDYVYDVQLTTLDGVVDTFIPLSVLHLTEEVD